MHQFVTDEMTQLVDKASEELVAMEAMFKNYKNRVEVDADLIGGVEAEGRVAVDAVPIRRGDARSVLENGRGIRTAMSKPVQQFSGS